jgi:hypothetical protein
VLFVSKRRTVEKIGTACEVLAFRESLFKAIKTGRERPSIMGLPPINVGRRLGEFFLAQGKKLGP